MTITPDYQRDWPAYFRAVGDKPARDTTRRALDALGPAEGRTAIDIACGEGRDTREMLRRGWRVVAIDSHPNGLEILAASVPPHLRALLTLSAATMETLPLDPALPPHAALCNASFALPFCNPDAFPSLWAWIGRVLTPGGIFSGQFFGNRDGWASVRPRSHHSAEDVQKLLEPFDVLWCEEIEKDGDDAMGGTKRHHVFHVVARRR